MASPVSVMLVNLPVEAVPPPIAPGLAKVLPLRVEALIVPVPVKLSDAPEPTNIEALVLVPLVMPEKGTLEALVAMKALLAVAALPEMLIE